MSYNHHSEAYRGIQQPPGCLKPFQMRNTPLTHYFYPLCNDLVFINSLFTWKKLLMQQLSVKRQQEKYICGYIWHQFMKRNRPIYERGKRMWLSHYELCYSITDIEKLMTIKSSNGTSKGIFQMHVVSIHEGKQTNIRTRQTNVAITLRVVLQYYRH